MKKKLLLSLFAVLALTQTAIAEDSYTRCTAYHTGSDIQKMCGYAKNNVTQTQPITQTPAVQPVPQTSFNRRCSAYHTGSNIQKQCWAAKKNANQGLGVLQPPAGPQQPEAAEPIRPVVMSRSYPVQEYHTHAFDYIAPMAKIIRGGGKEFTRMTPGMYSLINNNGSRGFSLGAPTKETMLNYFSIMMVIPKEYLVVSEVDYETNSVKVFLLTDNDWYKANRSRFPNPRRY